MITLAALAVAGCLAVARDSDHIYFRDLAAAFPGVESVAADVPVALAPLPGVRRVFRIPELRRMALRLRIAAEPQSEICVERTVSHPDPALFLAAMQQAMPQATIEILAYSHQPLPAGNIEFPAASVRPGAAGALWTGYVRYTGNRRFPVWAQVKITEAVQRVVAVEDLRPGQTIGAEQLRLETRAEFPTAARFPQSIEEVAGKWPRLPIRAGAPVRSDQLRSPQEVLRGDTVHVDVRSGGAHLELEARAEASGALGETIPVRNPVSSRRFLARVEGKGRVSVDGSVLKVNP